MASKTHPEPKDLVNFARDELGDRRKEKILEHCKKCEYCADQLLEAVREHSPPPGPIKLSWWNWASIVLFVVLIVALIVGFVWFVRQAPEQPSFDPQAPPEIEAPGGDEASRPGRSPSGP